jgi:hypothetical protein
MITIRSARLFIATINGNNVASDYVLANGGDTIDRLFTLVEGESKLFGIAIWPTNNHSFFGGTKLAEVLSELL